MMDQTRLAVVMSNANVGAFLHVIREGESSQDDTIAYNLLNGGGRFESFDAHPFGELPTTQGGKAAGAYQFLPTTWAGLRKRWPQYLKGFTPPEQDIGAVLYLYELGALDDVLAGRVPQATARLVSIWISLPGGRDGARYPMRRALDVFTRYGGQLAGQGEEQPAAPIESQETPARPEDGARIFNPEQDAPNMLPLIAALAPIAVPLVQSLIQSFSPLARDKIAQEMNRHTSDPAVGNQIASDILAAITKLTGQADPVMAVAQVKQDPALAQQAEVDALTVLERMAPLLEKIAAHDERVWAAEERSRDAAGVRGRADGENDIGRPILWAVVALCGGSLVFLFSIMGVQTVTNPSHEPSTSMLTLVGPLIGGLFTALGTLVAYRFGTTRNNSLKDITVEQLSRRK